MSLKSDYTANVRLLDGWGGTLSVGTHSPPRESRDMNLSQLVPLIDWVASDSMLRWVDEVLKPYLIINRPPPGIVPVIT